MAGITKLEDLLRSMRPRLVEGEFVFCTVSGGVGKYLPLDPVLTFMETEGLTLLLPRHKAEEAGLAFDGAFRQITLMVHSSLDAVGLTAWVSGKLAERGICANVVAAYFHDHIFVQSEKSDAALLALSEIEV